MGPYSETKQSQRKANLKLILANPKLPEDVRNIWTQHLNNLSVNEEEYNKKVKQIYSLLKPKFRGRGF
tara:strand:+ start:818 stop:1021 length:204 start_codon:yes stop_codon:yes gene_type:complete